MADNENGGNKPEHEDEIQDLEFEETDDEDSSIYPYDFPEDDVEFVRRSIRRRRLRRLVIVLVLMVLAYAWVSSYVHRVVIRNRLSKEQFAYLERFYREPVHVPQEWQKVEPFPADLVELCKKFRDKWEPNLSAALVDTTTGYVSIMRRYEAGSDISDNEWDSIREFLAETGDVLNDIRSIVNHPKYEIEIWTGDEYYKIQGKALPSSNRWLKLMEYSYEKDGNSEEAIGIALLSIALAKRHPASLLPCHLVGIAVELGAFSTISRVSESCNRPDLLRHSGEVK